MRLHLNLKRLTITYLITNSLYLEIVHLTIIQILKNGIP
jgi:hypothetical protein